MENELRAMFPDWAFINLVLWSLFWSIVFAFTELAVSMGIPRYGE